MVMSDGASAVALTSIRALCYLMLGYAIFYLVMFLGKWYESEVMNDQLDFMLHGDLEIRSSYSQKFLFVGLPIILSAALGGVYEAIWKAREANASKLGASNGDEPNDAGSFKLFSLLHNIVNCQFRPMVGRGPWVTVGEAMVCFFWVFGMGAQCWQANLNHGNHFYDIYAACADDPSSWCNKYSGEVGPTPDQYRLRMVAVFMGLVATTHFAIILVPVSRDSKIWSALGIPFERAVLYHAVAGHMAFITTFLHATLFIAHWVWFKGWSHVWHESIHVDLNTHGGVDTPMGWMAALCAIPMWITSANYVRRRWYSLFKLSHFLFIGVFVFAVMHYAPNALYFLGGLCLYIMHIMSRLQSWKRWRYWNRWLSPETKASPTSLVSVRTNDNYTRLVLRNPKAEPARGGTFVYLSVPGALGTDEAHAITVALRGAPPTSTPTKIKPPAQDEVFTVYIKDLGPWTRALKLTARGAEAAASPASLLVDVDGFYNHVDSFNSMMKAGASRVVVVAGGSGMTSLMGFIQDWCIAAAEGATVPAVHLAWCCRDMAEMELVGETLPSMLATAGNVKNTHFTMSLYCSSKALSSEGALHVTWPLDNMAYANSSTKQHVIGDGSIAASLNHSVRVLIAGFAAFGGFLLGMHEVDRRGLMNIYHEGAIIWVLMIICIISALVVYGWICSLVQKFFLTNTAGSRTDNGSTVQESKMDLESSSMGGCITHEVQRGRIPTTALLTQEAEMAKKNGHHSVKVLTSGPASLVDSVLAETRAIDWQLFDTEAFSFEF